MNIFVFVINDNKNNELIELHVRHRTKDDASDLVNAWLKKENSEMINLSAKHTFVNMRIDSIKYPGFPDSVGIFAKESHFRQVV